MEKESGIKTKADNGSARALRRAQHGTRTVGDGLVKRGEERSQQQAKLIFEQTPLQAINKFGPQGLKARVRCNSSGILRQPEGVREKPLKSGGRQPNFEIKMSQRTSTKTRNLWIRLLISHWSASPEEAVEKVPPTSTLPENLGRRPYIAKEGRPLSGATGQLGGIEMKSRACMVPQKNTSAVCVDCTVFACWGQKIFTENQASVGPSWGAGKTIHL